MKPSQTAMLADLSKCCLCKAHEQYNLAWVMSLPKHARLKPHEARWLKYAWNRYRNQILHNKKQRRVR